MSDDWRNRGGTVQAGIVLSPMNMNVEHVFGLIEVKSKLGVQTPYGIKDKIQLIWKEVTNDKESHRVWTEFNESYAEKSGLVGFISRASPKPIMPGVTIKLGDYLEIGMQIRTLVQARIDKKTGLPNGYYDFIPASIKPAGSLSLPIPTQTHSATLANALLLAKGAKDSMDAYCKLTDQKAPSDLIALFIQADKLGQVKYPI